MLDTDYQRRLGTLISSIHHRIVLPESLGGFFEESGPVASYGSDRRSAVRTKVRTRGLLMPIRAIPINPRVGEPTGIYTKDFSKTGFGFVADSQFYPGEHVRIILATFWMQICVRRCRRHGESCFEVGGTLVHQREPSMDAFELPSDAVNVVPAEAAIPTP